MSYKVVFIDGISDYSVVTKQIRYKIVYQPFLYLSHYLGKINFDCKYIDFRSRYFDFDEFIETIKHYELIFININIDNISSYVKICLKDYTKSYIIAFSDFSIPNNFVNNFDFIININKEFEYPDYVIETKKIIQKIFNTKISNFSLQDYEFQPDWKIISELETYSIEIITAWGCGRSCNFCLLSNSDVITRRLNSIKSEIDYLLKQGISLFHIKNHNFLANKNHVIEVTRIISEMQQERNFFWSFFIIPEYANNINNIFKTTNIARVEIGVETFLKDIAENLNISTDFQQIEKLINILLLLSVPSISINLIIGSNAESNATLEQTLKYANDIFNIGYGFIEFSFSYYYPIKYLKDKNNYEETRKGILKRNCLVKSDYLTIKELAVIKMNFVRIITIWQKKSIKSLTQKQRLFHFLLNDNGISTQYFLYFLSKSSTAKIYDLKKTNPFIKSSWEIQQEILSYYPVIAGVLSKNENGEFIFVTDSLFADENQMQIILNDKELFLVELASQRLRLELIVNRYMLKYNNLENSVLNNEVIHFYKKLENYDLLFFTKIFE